MRRQRSAVLAERSGQLALALPASPALSEPETVELEEEPCCLECKELLLPPYLVCEACGQGAFPKEQDGPSSAPGEAKGTLTPAARASLVIAKCLVNRAKLTPDLMTLLPYSGPDNVLLDQAWATQTIQAQQIVGYAHLTSFLAVEMRRFDRVILWSDEVELAEEREYFLHGFELLKPGGKLVAAISTELSTDRSFRVWASKKSATFEEPGSSFRSRGLVMVTLWKGA